MNKKDLLMIAIITLLTVTSWIVYDVYHSATTNTITPVQEELIAPLDPHIDADVVLKVVDNTQ